MGNILVLGGAGYIGSHFCRLAADAGHHITVYDDFTTGHEWAVSGFRVIKGSILDINLLAEALDKIDSVCHFAAKSIVSESFENSMLYYMNNVEGTRSVLAAMRTAEVRSLVFSSTAAIYGVPSDNMRNITEDAPCGPINPYGASKLRAENLIHEWVQSGSGSAISLRYFNAAGALPLFGLGEAHDPETHLIPNILRALTRGNASSFELFGNDYGTPDGTCIRDYVHVADIADAHIKSLEYLNQKKNSFIVCNLGTGRGYSNQEVINACENVHGGPLRYSIRDRRLGDPPYLVASNARALSLLGWVPKRSGLVEIVKTAYEWHLHHG